MDGYEYEHEDILGKALERLNQINEANASLRLELAEADGRLASYRAELQRAARLQEENASLVHQLENARKQLKALKDIVIKGMGEVREEVQHLNKKIEATYTVLDLYDLLYESEPPAEPTRRRDAPADIHRQPDQVISLEKRLRVVPEEAGWETETTPSAPDVAMPAQDREVESFTANEDEPALDSDVATSPDAARAEAEGVSVETFREPVAVFDGRPGDPDAEEQAWAKPESLPQAPPHTANGAPGNEIDLIVSPFTRFDTINKFTAAVRALSGVSDAKVRHFQKGTLRMTVEYEGVAPFVNRLQELTLFRVKIENASADHVTAKLDVPENALSASGAR